MHAVRRPACHLRRLIRAVNRTQRVHNPLRDARRAARLPPGPSSSRDRGEIPLTYLTAIGLLAFGLGGTLALSPVAKYVARSHGFMSVPRGRRIHQKPVPLLGGLAIGVPFGIISVAALLLLWSESPGPRLPSIPEVLALTVGTTIVFLVGAADDKWRISWRKKLAGQAVAGLVALAGGHTIASATVPWVGAVDFGWLGYPLLFFAVIVITNAFNLVDGIDGLAGGIGLFAALTMGVIAFAKGDPYAAAVGFVLAGSLAGFLVHNLPPASIFMGDGGSLMVGFLLATMALSGAAVFPGQRKGTAAMIVIPFLPFAIPLLDVALSVARRWIRGQLVFGGDSDHLHHRLSARVQNPRLTIGIFYLFSAAACLLTLLFVLCNESNTISFLCGAITLLLFAGAVAAIGLYRVDTLVGAMRKRPHFRALGHYLDRMKWTMRKARSVPELLMMLETGVTELAFDRVTVMHNETVAGDWRNDAPVHLSSSRVEAREHFPDENVTVEWVRPIHDDDTYNQYPALTWLRCIDLLRAELRRRQQFVAEKHVRSVIA